MISHHIELVKGTSPVRVIPYRINPSKVAMVKNELKELLRLGIITPSASPWASGIVLVPKESGETRLCSDFRRVNEFTVADPLPLPRVEDLIDRVGRSTFRTKIDMT